MSFHAILNLVGQCLFLKGGGAAVIWPITGLFAVFLDLSKAFDLVRHDILLDKLKRIRLDDVSIDWFTSYPSNR